MPPKKTFKTNELTISEKIELINDWETGKFSKIELSIKYKVCPQTVTNTLNRKEKILRISEVNRGSKRTNPKTSELNDLVLKFIKSANSTQTPIDRSIIRGFALEVASRLK